VFVFKSSEYVPAPVIFGGTVIGLLWLWAGILMQDIYVVVSCLCLNHNFNNLQRANVAGLILNVMQHILLIAYPPKTWVVPIYGVGGKEQLKKKE
jgi:hypothetical protein